MLRRLAPLSALLLAACFSVSNHQLQSASAAFAGCTPDEVVVSNVRSSEMPVTWQAQCRGRSFQCMGAGNNIQCSPLAPAAAPCTTTAAAPQPPPATPAQGL